MRCCFIVKTLSFLLMQLQVKKKKNSLFTIKICSICVVVVAYLVNTNLSCVVFNSTTY